MCLSLYEQLISCLISLLKPFCQYFRCLFFREEDKQMIYNHLNCSEELFPSALMGSILAKKSIVGLNCIFDIVYELDEVLDFFGAFDFLEG